MPPRAAAISALLIPAAAAHAQCPDGWLPAHPDFGVLGTVYAMTLFDPDGPGPAPERLIVAGDIDLAGTMPVANIAAWDGEAWSPLGTGLSGLAVYALTVHNGELIAAGKFSAAGGIPATNVAAWNGAVWRPLSLAALRGVGSLAVEDGELYAALYSIFYGEAGPLMRRDTASWVAVPTPCWSVGRVVAYGGRLLIAGGGGSAEGVCVRLHTTSGWHQLGDDWLDHPKPVVYALAGSGPWAILSGNIGFYSSALWNGTSWTQPSILPVPRWFVTVADFHEQAVVGGNFAGVAEVETPGIARYDGASWHPMAPGVSGATATVNALLVREDRLIIGGSFSSAGGRPAASLALWGPAPACYANCDCSSEPPILSINDFTCFLNKFAASDPSANCDASTAAPYLNISDFICFLNRYAAGCP